MASNIKPKDLFREAIFLSILSLASLAIYLFRVVNYETYFYLFLNWNLFLAALPWILTAITLLRPRLQKRKLALAGVLISWLLFFPNAPYILTDLFHLRKNLTIPLWFDLIMILFYAWTGLMFGFLSLQHLERIFENSISKLVMRLLIVFMFFIVGFGIYIGRYLRWNSWDIIGNPKPLIYDIANRFIHPTEHMHTWGMTFFMGLFLIILYLSLKYIRTNNIAPQ